MCRGANVPASRDRPISLVLRVTPYAYYFNTYLYSIELGNNNNILFRSLPEAANIIIIFVRRAQACSVIESAVERLFRSNAKLKNLNNSNG